MPAKQKQNAKFASSKHFPLYGSCGRAYSGSYVYSEGVANPPSKVHDSKER